MTPYDVWQKHTNTPCLSVYMVIFEFHCYNFTKAVFVSVFETTRLQSSH